ncbi:MAG: hypothetical protein KDD50_07610 [Bdellovibrionales bacterium]|nr:hypothetical protein [Bdellovibrionales bacterium]
MNFEKVFIERPLISKKNTQKVLDSIKYQEIIEIENVDKYFGRFKKPYLQKRTSLNLYLGEKKGQLVKQAPEAYGISNELHFYFIHAYNCIYECEYCYLQGYFHNPDIVLFLNHDEIALEIERTIAANPSQKIWFHAGEFSDSLALSHITGELDLYWETIEKYPDVKLELRTKSVNLKALLEKKPLKNVIVTYSISPAESIKAYEHKTPQLEARIRAIKKLQDYGFSVALHFDPIVWSSDIIERYQRLIDKLNSSIHFNDIMYLSLGVVRFTKDVYNQVQQNYPHSDLLAQNFVRSFDDKIRYNKPSRLWILNNIKSMCLNAGVDEEKIYLCME